MSAALLNEMRVPTPARLDADRKAVAGSASRVTGSPVMTPKSLSARWPRPARSAGPTRPAGVPSLQHASRVTGSASRVILSGVMTGSPVMTSKSLPGP
jgi:hypothetical protein